MVVYKYTFVYTRDDGTDRMHNRIAEFRHQQGITQDRLAQQVGISRPYLSDVERGRKDPGAAIAQRICLALGHPFEQVFPVTDES